MEMNYNPDFQAARKLEEIFTCFHVKSDIVCLLLLLLWPCDVFTECISYSSCRMSVILIIKAIFGNLMLSMRNIQNEVGELCWFSSSLTLVVVPSICVYFDQFFVFYIVFSLETEDIDHSGKRVSEVDTEKERVRKNKIPIYSHTQSFGLRSTAFLFRWPHLCVSVLCGAVFGQDDEWKSKWNFDSKYYHFLWQ